MRLILPRGRFRLEFLLKILHAFRISLMKSLNPIQTNIPNQELFFFFPGHLTWNENGKQIYAVLLKQSSSTDTEVTKFRSATEVGH